MKLTDFKNELRSSVEKICIANGWNIQDNKYRGMAFEDWCFQLLSDKHPTADVDKAEAILRTDDGGIDIIFESADTQEAYVVQCKYPLIAQSKPMPEDKVKEFFSNFELLKDSNYMKDRNGKNQRLHDLANELKYWLSENWTVYFVFISSDTRGQNITA
ncbi:MAG: restriction endonuclease, partial [Alphaproteobacteria bacterium]|nr:restriction endonuclease [Alphaproteobacteria bacterium]